jgi:hypothetical protein
MQKKYDEGERSHDFMVKYLMMNADSEDEKIQSIAQDFLSALPEKELLKEDNFKIMKLYTNDSKSKEFQFYLKNIQKFVDMYGEENGELAFKMMDLLYNKALMEQNENHLKDLYALMLQLDPVIPQEKVDVISDKAYINFYEQTEDWVNYTKKSVEFIEKHDKDDADNITRTTYNFYLHTVDTKALKKAEGWLKGLIEAKDWFAYHYILGGIYFKNDKKNLALEQIEIALKQAAEIDAEADIVNEMEELKSSIENL